MENQTEFLVLHGPCHLQVVKLPAGETQYSVTDETPGLNPVPTFTYVVVKVGAGSHPPVGFLIPAPFSNGEKKDIAAWVFNRLVQALMGAHPLGGDTVLRIGYRKLSSTPHSDRYEVSAGAHPVGANGIVRLAPDTISTGRVEIDREALALPDYVEQIAGRAIFGVVEPFIQLAARNMLASG